MVEVLEIKVLYIKLWFDEDVQLQVMKRCTSRDILKIDPIKYSVENIDSRLLQDFNPIKYYDCIYVLSPLKSLSDKSINYWRKITLSGLR